MKLLRETIRRIILQEGMVTPDELPADIGIHVVFRKGDKYAHIRYCGINPDGTIGRSYSSAANPGRDGIFGNVMCHKIEDSANCDGAWVIDSTDALSGYGPLLYDIAMEISTMDGSGLVSDRRSVSMEAHDVWQYYLDNRPDVTVFQCDDRDDSLTPDPSDNLDQRIPKNAYGYDTSEWTDHQLSKRYSKPNVWYDTLDRAGKLFVVRK